MLLPDINNTEFNFLNFKRKKINIFFLQNNCSYLNIKIRFISNSSNRRCKIITQYYYLVKTKTPDKRYCFKMNNFPKCHSLKVKNISLQN